MRAVTHTKACAIAGMRDRRIVTRRRASQLSIHTSLWLRPPRKIVDLRAKMRGVGVGRRLLSSKAFSAPIYQFDSFARRPFAGNPAAVVPLERWPSDDETLRSIAAENNLSETAFVVSYGKRSNYHIRWFTPTVEVNCCGHATLATGQ